MSQNMDSQLQPSSHPAARDLAVPALFLHPYFHDLQNARVDGPQQLLFPSEPRVVCNELRLNWWAAVKLHDEGWLSFAPEKTARLDEAQEAELRFVGSLVVAGCDHGMLGVMLKGLPKPYAYDLRRLFFDWLGRRWRLLPDNTPDAEGVFADWVEALVQNRDADSLRGISELAQDGLARIGPAQPELEPRFDHVTNDGEQLQG